MALERSHGKAEGLTIVRLSALPAAERDALLDRYRREVYEPAFPDAEIREDPGYWRRLLDADSYPPPPQPRIEVAVALGSGGRVAGGVTVEFYRTARCGLLTYIAVGGQDRGRGVGHMLVAAARDALATMAGAAVPLFAETERYQDANDDAERRATRLRQRQLAGLGARQIDFDYWMPPLRTGLKPHQLHLLMFDTASDVSPSQVAALLDELARALGTDLAAFAETRAMQAELRTRERLATCPLPTGDVP